VSTLSNAELNALAATYRRLIRHGINNDPNANASAFVNENQVFVNFGNLFPDGGAEIAQSRELANSEYSVLPRLGVQSNKGNS
jgi:hypothetical protein